MDISANIKAARGSLSVSQAELARRLELDPSSYHRLENRGNKLSIEQLVAIATALGIKLLDILTWGEENHKSQSEAALIKEAESLRERVKELEEIIEIQSELSKMRRIAAKQLHDQYSEMELSEEYTDRPEVKVYNMMLSFMAVLANVDEKPNP